ncbi:MAG: FtsX-like permease family protein [Thermoguttaceae bacterium]|nr:FtsX-like permease family protein [Thermoguttaceae bacterium]
MNTDHVIKNSSQRSITLYALSRKSFLQYWREHLLVFVAIAIVVAILIGGGLLGDSVQNSLRDRAIARLGGIEEVITSEIPFRQAMGDAIPALSSGTFVTPVLQLRTTITTDTLNSRKPPEDEQKNIDDHINIDGQKNIHDQKKTYTASTSLMGCRKDFFQFFPAAHSQCQTKTLENWQGAIIAVNDVLMTRLSIQQGDSLLIRLPSNSDIPTDSALGRKTELIRTVRVTVVPLPNDAAQDFSLTFDQRKQPLAFVPLEWISDQMNMSGYANMLLAGHSRTRQTESNRDLERNHDAIGMDKTILSSIRPTLDDLGLSISESQLGVWNLTSKQMFISPLQQKILTLPSFPKERQEVLLWLANTIAAENKDSQPRVDPNMSTVSPSVAIRNDEESTQAASDTTRQIPYSTVAASTFFEPFSQHFVDSVGRSIPKLKSGEIVLNRWTSDQLNIKPGDFVTLEYFVPDTTLVPSVEADRPKEKKSTPSESLPTRTIRFQVVAIAEMNPYTTSSDWTPTVRGLTDAKTMKHWDAPFPFDATRIRPEDEAYWQTYGTAPKAFISDVDGQKMWGSRFGTMTSVRLEKVKKNGKTLTIEEFAFILSHDISEHLNTSIFPPRLVRKEALASAAGNTPFGVLFMMCSSFLLISAMLLIIQLTQLSIERRAKELGVLFALGWTRSRIILLFLCENGWITITGALLGIPLGIIYAYILVYGLQHWWTDAIGESFVHLAIGSESILIGLSSGIFISMSVIFLVIRRFSKQPAFYLLAGNLATISNPSRQHLIKSIRFKKIAVILCILMAIGIYSVTSYPDLMLRAGAFFTAGLLVLLAGILWIHQKMQSKFLNNGTPANEFQLKSLIWENTMRNPHRSLTIAVLIATSVFLVTAMSAFELYPAQPTDRVTSNAKPWWETWVAETDRPIPYSLTTKQDRISAGFTDEDVSQLSDVKIYGFRSHGSDDASCKNLYHVQNPMIIGVPQTWMNRGRKTETELSAYQPLFRPMTQDADGVWRIPMIVDKNTAMYALQLWNGIGSCFEMRDEHGNLLRFELVGMTTNSHFPGALWISEEHLLTLWPETQGWNRWVIDVNIPQSIGSLSETNILPNATSQDSKRLKILGDVLGDFGWSTRRLMDVQREQMNIQNTYLAIFQLLGILGVLLGLPAMLVVQLRAMRERQSELAILRAIGFSNRRIQWILFMENCVLLLMGTGLGVIAALVTTIPLNELGSSVPLLKPLGLFLAMIGLGGGCAWIASRQVFRVSIVTALRAP